MAKINKFLIEYGEMLEKIKIADPKKGEVSAFIRKFVHFIDDKIEDPRYEGMCDYPLATIVVSTFLAILSGSDTWSEIAVYADWHYEDLSKYLKFPDGRTPIDDTYRRVFSLLNMRDLASTCANFILSFYYKIEKQAIKYFEKHRDEFPTHFLKDGFTILNIDGKEARATGRNYDDPEKKIHNLQLLNIHDASHGVVISSIPISSKENEIPVAQQFLNTISLHKTIVTFDALHCQHATFHSIVGKKKSKDCGDFLITLKENQKTLYDLAVAKFSNENLEKIKSEGDNYSKLGEKEFYVIPFSKFKIICHDTENGYKEWEGVRNIACYTHINKRTGELIKMFFVTSLNDMELILNAIVRRWDVENKLHNPLDVVFGADEDKTIDVNAYTNLETIRKLANSFLRLVQPHLKDLSKKQVRKVMGYDTFKLLKQIAVVLNFKTVEQAFDEEIKKINNNN